MSASLEWLAEYLDGRTLVVILTDRAGEEISAPGYVLGGQGLRGAWRIEDESLILTAPDSVWPFCSVTAWGACILFFGSGHSLCDVDFGEARRSERNEFRIVWPEEGIYRIGVKE